MNSARSPEPTAEWALRLAHENDVPALEALIPVSVRALQASHYSPAQPDAALGAVYGVERQLVRDGTYFVATLAGEPLHASLGYAAVERYEIAMAGGLKLPVVRMARSM